MKKIFTLLLMTIMIFTNLSTVQAEKNNTYHIYDAAKNDDNNSTAIPKELLYYGDKNSDEEQLQLQSHDKYSKNKINQLLDDLLEKKIELSRSNSSQIKSNLELNTIYLELQKNGATRLSQDQVNQIYMSKSNFNTLSKPYVPADTRKYDFISISTTMYDSGVPYDVFYIFVQPNTYMFGNMLVNSDDKYTLISEETLSSEVTNNTLFSIYSQKAIGFILDQTLKYGSVIPFELFWPSGNYTGTKVKNLVSHDLYTTLCFMYVSEHKINAYEKIISTSKITGSFTFKTAVINASSKTVDIDFNGESKYYNDDSKAVNFFKNGDIVNHYYPYDNINIVDKENNILYTANVRTVSDFASLN